MNKILFLDIDGVLNYMPDRELLETLKNNLGYEKFQHEIYGFSNKLVEYLKMIIDATNCKIVFSTSWRYFKDHHIEGSDWRKTLADLLTVDQSIFLGNTPDISSGWDNGTFSRRRGSEIKMWLECNTEPGKYKFCVIDDEVCDIIPVIPKKNVIHVNMKTGLTIDDAKRAIAILNG
jgi:hypothetical protein